MTPNKTNKTNKKYIPLHKRNTNNTFKRNKSTSNTNKFELLNNLFPSLNNHYEVGQIVEPTINYADIAKKRHEEEPEGHEQLTPGWMYIHKNGTIKYTKSNRYDSVYRLLRVLHENKINNAIDSILDRHEYDEMIDLELNGPKYVYGWEIDRILEGEKYNNDEDETDDEYDNNDYYNDGNLM